MKPQRRTLSIHLFNEVLYFIPHYFRKEILHVIEYDDAVYLPNSSTHTEKGIMYCTAVQMAGKHVDDVPFNPDNGDYFLKLIKVKSWGAFSSNSLCLSTDQSEDVIEFGPNEYYRGGFSGLGDLCFTIPTDSTPEEIGQAIDKALSFCIGKKKKS